jgi:septum formation protein
MDLNKKWDKVILGSQSPRRKELLKGLDIEFEIRVADIDESFPVEMKTDEVGEFIAQNKLDAIQRTNNLNELIICSDTIVVLGNEILGKPTDKLDAARMLKKLSGKTHLVISSVAMADTNKKLTFSDKTEVTFKNLSEEEIEYYLENYAPYDKAGSYGVQEWIGMTAITKMDGSYFTVMGLPVHRVYEEMKNW